MNERNRFQPLVPLDSRRLDRTPSLPAWLPQRIAALESELQPDSTGNRHLVVVLPTSMILNSSERAVVEQCTADRASRLNVRQTITIDGRTLSNDQAINFIIAKLLLKPSGPKLDETSSGALAEDYLDAIEDLPAWSVRSALRNWNRGESITLDGEKHDFKWRPAPATLRRLAQIELAPIKAEMAQLEKLLIAVPRLEFSDEHRAKMLALLKELGISLRAV